ncbi:MAG TPA: PDZ domain-containing protein [Longimicrobiales bacterium]
MNPLVSRGGARCAAAFRLAAFLVSIIALFVLATAAAAQGTRLLREPTVSDTHIVFVYANDLWIVGREGGEARRLTSHEGEETMPHFSPDGRHIAFTGEYGGNADVYVIPAEGGQPRRLTWHPGADIVQGWTPDGSAVLFSSGREGHPTARRKFFTVPIDGGLPEALAIPQAWTGELSADGRFVAYQEFGFFDPEWRNYRGGQAQPIRIVSMDDYSLVTAPWDGERQMEPVWLDGVVYFLSERDWASNIWSFDPRTGELRQRTFHTDFDVKSLDAGGGVIVYEQGGWLHLLDPATDETRRLEIEVRGDMNWARPRWVEIEPRRIANASLSPTGKRAVFEARGEIFTVPAEHGDWRNLSTSSGAADRFPVWSPDGSRIAWFSDASGEYRLVIRDQKALEEPRVIALPNPTFYYRPQWSPDGRYIAYTDADMNLWYVDVESGEATKVDTERHAYPERSMEPVWSPDSRWIAYARRLDSHLRAIFVHDVATGETHQVTDGMADAISPAWDASGKYLYFLASTDFALNVGWLDMSSYDRPVSRAVYLAVLAADEPSPLLPRSDEEPATRADSASQGDEGDEGDEGGAGRGAGGGDVVVRIDFEGLDQRILALGVPERDYVGLLAGPAGTIFYAERIPNEQGLTLHRYTFEKREAETFLSPIQTASLSKDRKKLLYRSGTRWGIVDTKGSAKVGDGALALNGLRMKLDPRAEWRQIFREGWRFQRDYLYVDNVHGAPWDQIYEWYRPWIEHVRHRSDLNYVLDILGGEVSIGHSYTSGGDFPDIEAVPTGLLGADLEASQGRYRIRRIYTGESWNPELRAPLSGPGIDVSEGDYILAINGVDLRVPDNPYRLLEGTADRQTVLLVNDRPTTEGAHEVVVVPTRSEGGLRTRAWIEANRRKVDELSDGRLAYVWLPNTAEAGYEAFNRYYFAQQDRKGAVIDERNNGGGSAADYMVYIMSRKLQGYFSSPVGDRAPFTLPEAGLWGPKVMVINESAGSGGDLLPYLFRQMEIGPLVGTRTWGGLVGIWDTPLFIDGGRMTAPRGGFFDLNGEWAVEGEGVAPDIPVEQTPAEVIAGHDPQLERAVAEALRLLETESVELLAEPAAPVKWRRPAPRAASSPGGR